MKENKKIVIRDITEIAILIAIAVVFDTFVKVPISFTGGSINFSFVPLIIIALRHGPLKGFIAGGIIYSLMTCLIDGYGIVTLPFDYIIPFGIVFVIGLFSKYILAQYGKHKALSLITLSGLILGCGIVRILSSSINSVLFYEVTYISGIIYNLPYVLPSIAIDIIIMLILLPTLIKLNNRYRSAYLYKYEAKKY